MKASASSNHTLYLNEYGKVLVSGKGEFGQLGFNLKQLKHSDTNLFEPVQLDFDEPIVDIQAGKDFSMFLSAKGLVYGCGLNSRGQLGLGDTSECYFKPTRIISLTNIHQIRCNEGSIALDTSG